MLAATQVGLRFGPTRKATMRLPYRKFFDSGEMHPDHDERGCRCSQPAHAPLSGSGTTTPPKFEWKDPVRAQLRQQVPRSSQASGFIVSRSAPAAPAAPVLASGQQLDECAMDADRT